MDTWERDLCDFIDMWNDVSEDQRDIIYKIMYKGHLIRITCYNYL